MLARLVVLRHNVRTLAGQAFVEASAQRPYSNIPMALKRFSPNQALNDWALMLHQLYGPTQNYSKTPYEVHAHLTEVCGIFAKHLFKKRDIEAAQAFLPKIFAWAVALLRTMRPDHTDLEDIILRKFPGVCPYCGECPCRCWDKEKPTLDAEALRQSYFRNAPALKRSVNDFQLMFRRIYGDTWTTDEPVQESLRKPFIRLVEELAEIAETIRFDHLYPTNFENELADLFAWWFALVSSLPKVESSEVLLAEDVLWHGYPGHCPYCSLFPCFCRPGPVRDLMSKPPPGQDHRFDALTAVYNHGAYNEDIERISHDDMPAAFPVACVRVDVDDFKDVNNTHGHPAGDAALRHISAVLRGKARERDRVYRVGGDEFAVLVMDSTEEEALGMMKRVCRELSERPVRWVSSIGEVKLFTVSTSIGVAQCDNSSDIESAFENADKASYRSKETGKARATAFSTVAVPAS